LWTKNREFFETFQANPATSGYVKLTDAYTGDCDIYYRQHEPANLPNSPGQ